MLKLLFMRFLLVIPFLFTSLMFSAQSKTTCVQTLKGEVRDKITNDLLASAIITLRDKDGNSIESQFTKDDAKFEFELQCNKEYKIEGRKNLYTAESKVFTTTNELNKKLKLIILLGKGNINFITDSSKLKDTVKSIKANSVKIDSLSKLLPANIIKNKENNYIIDIDPIYFDFNSSYLNYKAKVELLKIVTVMKKNPSMIIESRSYTDSKGSESFNKWLSDRRAKRTVQFIISKGINPSRITGKGFGDTHLINKCKKNVSCTEEQHAANRRTEFVIINM